MGPAMGGRVAAPLLLLLLLPRSTDSSSHVLFPFIYFLHFAIFHMISVPVPHTTNSRLLRDLPLLLYYYYQFFCLFYYSYH
uniref:Secreted protein n=1 Tax=Anopheles darlingi TaxID=43151 RepID=A0A2M4DFK5_ANODA